MTEEEAEALKKKKMYMGIGVACCLLLIIVIAVVAATSGGGGNDGDKPFVRLCLPGMFHDGSKCRLNCDKGCKTCDEETRAC